MIWLHYCVGIIDASGCVFMCLCVWVFLCVGFFFPFKSRCCYCRRSRRCRAESKHAFIFCLSFYLQGDIQCQRLPFDLRQSPAGQKTFGETWGEGKKAPLGPNAGVSVPSKARPQTIPTHRPPLKNHFPFYPPGPGREAAPRQRGASTQGLTFLFSAGTCWLASLSGIPSV